VAAALAWRAVLDPGTLEDHLEALETAGFGDPALAQLAKEIIRVRLDVDHLDSGLLRSHLVERGFSVLLADIAQAAALSGAPFLERDIDLSAARSQWSHAFDIVSRVAALEQAMVLAKQGLAAGSGSASLMALKGERDRLRRAISSRKIWSPEQLD
jgi:DNA primase